MEPSKLIRKEMNFLVDGRTINEDDSDISKNGIHTSLAADTMQQDRGKRGTRDVSY
jgi:hypothetical protein